MNYKLYNLKQILFKKARNFIFDEFPKLSYARYGEDLILNELFESKGSGIYIDVGCHDPIRNSNTYLFYTKGWRGINIDANKSKIELFNTIRPNDININIAISEHQGEIKYYEIEEDDSMNTTNLDFLQRKINSNSYKIKSEKIIIADRLENILKKYLKEKNIDLMNIDVEGSELDILHSNNWALYVPKVILIETIIKEMNFNENPVFEYLQKRNYYVHSIIKMNINLANIIFISKESEIFKKIISK